MKKPLFKATALSVALGVFTPLSVHAAPLSNADLQKQLEALSRRVLELEQKLAEKNAAAPAVADQETDQRLRVLDRKLELAEEGLEDRNLEGAENIVAGRDQGSANRSVGLESFASRIGVRGEVALGAGDLNAIYQAEYELNVDNGSSGDTSFSQRNVFAGLKSATWGQLIAGKIDTPFKSTEGKFDQFNDLRGDIDNLIGGQNRVDNIVILSSPKFFDALTINLGLIQPENAADVDYDGAPDDDFADAYSASVVYDQGSFYGALGYDKNVSARRSVDQTVTATTIGYAGTYTEAYRAVGGYRTELWEAGVLLQRSSDQRKETGANGIGEREDEAYLLSGAYNILPKLKLKAQYGVAKGDYTDEKGKLSALGADYNFTPKTKVYSYYSLLDLDKAEAQDKTFAVGLDHSF
jgi:predicted porin